MAGSRGMREQRVGAAEIDRMQAAAAILVECRSAFAADAGGPLAGAAAGAEEIADWRHYPVGEVYDPLSHAQYFYHRHPAAVRPAAEHGHFHTFLRAEGMPFGAVPLVLPETAVADAPSLPPQAAPLKLGERDEISHLVAIALDHRGDPIRLFTTNRWVTGETWYRAEDVIGMLDRFHVGAQSGPAGLNRWISAIVALFHPQIATLLRMRDAAVMSWRRRRRTNVFEDERLEILSSVDVDLDRQFALLDRARTEFVANRSAGTLRLPPMAEGWGEGHAG